MNESSPHLKSGFSKAYVVSLMAAFLLLIISLSGVFFPQAVYPTGELRRSFLSNDVVNLFIGLPVLLGALWLAHKGKLMGFLYWLGAFLYIGYNAIAYIAALPLGLVFFANLVLLILSLYTLFRLLFSLDAKAVKERLEGKVPERFAGGVLMGLGALFFVRGVVQLAQASSFTPELAVVIADLLVTPLWMAGGFLLWRKRPLGYASGGGLLFQASMLFVALLVFFLVQPSISGVTFKAEDFVVIFVMGLVCFIPFGLFLRGVVRSGGKSL